MTGLRAQLSDGDWLTHRRLVVYPLAMMVLITAATASVLTANGGALPNGAPFGSDFVSYWVAAREALAGRPLVPYDRALFEPVQMALFPDAGFFAFFYPPHYLAYLMPLGALPFHAAMWVWSVGSFAATGLVLSLITGRPREAVLLALIFPVAFLNLAHGQNAFLSAALLGGALHALPTRPVLAGVLLGLLTFKPQLGLLVPFALLAAGQWRAIASAAATLGALVLGSAALFGVEVWSAFAAQGAYAMETLRLGHVGWEKMISVYAALRVAGMADQAAMAVHWAIALGVAAIVIRCWLPRSGVAHETRAALLITGALIVTPFGLNYDLFLLAPAAAFLAKRGMTDGFMAYEKTVMAVLFVLPMGLLWMISTGLNVVPALLVGLFALIAIRAAAEHASPLVQPAE